MEQGYQQMKEELGLDHFEGRSWRGFHHHACLVMLAYGFLLLERPAPGGAARPGAEKGGADRPLTLPAIRRALQRCWPRSPSPTARTAGPSGQRF